MVNETKIQKSASFKKKISYEVPYAVGTYLKPVDTQEDIVDQLVEYRITEQGISAILTLNVFQDAKRSLTQSLENLEKNWQKYEQPFLRKIPSKEDLLFPEIEENNLSCSQEEKRPYTKK